LIRAGEQDADLLAAALLHDVGKSSSRLHIWERAAAVLASWLIPDQARRWSNGPASGWRRPFVIGRHHPHWGAELVEQAGGSQRLIELIRQHQDREAAACDPLLRRLQAADGKN
jgi:putative nucleotidyltransferase with HDIG domain